MRIGYDAKRLYGNFTGLGNYSRSLVKNMQAYFPKEEYFLYTPTIKRSPETELFSDSPYFQTYLAKTVFKSYWRSYSISDQLIKDKIELYHGLSNEIPVNLKKRGIKSIVTIHDLIFKVLPETYSFFDRNMYDLKFRASCLHADKIIAISNNTKKDIIKFYNIDPAKIEVIYQSCNPLFNERVDKKESDIILRENGIPQEYLLFVGSIEKRKNLKLIIEAYRHLKGEFRLPLVVIGDGKTYKKEVLELIKKEGLEKNVLWIAGLKDNFILRGIYQRAMALIYPSLYEGFGLPVVEGLLSKTPVITSNTSSLKEAGGPNSIYIDPNNAEELARAITVLMTDTAHRNVMVDSGYNYAINSFSAEQVSHQLMDCYRETVHNKK